ncbi:HAD family hydrolase [Mycobacterium sp. Marseille-P9652]|uniref:HAD family hydrolase n=1 Tax=Mycobacterium sp. Marseille-P9652 TaxID=2654950 RepID=UPI001E2D5519|nr:HAD family hydrolase [Mycobacterium sp. Marseille-P9652]
MATLDSWNDGPAKSAIIDFVDRVTHERSADFVAPDARVAVFDNDGTLWCEKPFYIQLDFLVRRFAEQAHADPSLREREPYKGAYEGDLTWLSDAVAKHHRGDDSELGPLVAAILSAHASITVDEHRARVEAFFRDATHPTLGRPYMSCAYRPMVELLRYLRAHGFTNFIVSGGGRDFIRPVSGLLYDIPPERVVGSSVGLTYRDGDLFTTAQPEFLDEGPIKPVRLWSRIGRRPTLAAGNSDGDIEMLHYTGASGTPSLRLLIRHDDAEREFAYTAGAEKAATLVEPSGWTAVSMRDDWASVFD